MMTKVTASPSMERMASTVAPLPPRSHFKADAPTRALNEHKAEQRAARGAHLTTLTISAEMAESIRIIRHWWPGVRSDNHSIEVALRWMAQQSLAGNVTTITL